MHHSEDPDRRLVAVGHYVDESGVDDHSTVAVVGGPVLDRDHFFSFHYEWDRLARAKHSITGAIHMKDFARPHGRLAYLTDAERGSLFLDLVTLINDSKTYSLTAHLANDVFQECFPPEAFRGLMGPAAYAFLWCLFWNNLLVEHYHLAPMAYVLSESEHDSQMKESHAAFRVFERGHNLPQSTGSITFDTPENVHALQAADLIAWSNRRRTLGEPFKEGFEPLYELTQDSRRRDGRKAQHIEHTITPDHMKALSRALSDGESLRKIGRLELAKWIANAVDSS